MWCSVWLLSVLLIALQLAGAIEVRADQTTPGSKACHGLTSSLGKFKVISSSLNPKYVLAKEGYWNARQSLYSPSCVVFPKTAKDVSTALKAAKAAGSRFAIKAGGHNPNKFFSSVDKGVLIDLMEMNKRTYDRTTTLGSYEPGGTFGHVYSYFAPFNRTVVGARLAGVGTGLALGGGLSYLSPQYGMACDSFRELEVVLPNGTIVTASPGKNPDVFFAMRGGGGNAYGVVTKYTVQTRPIGTFYAGNIIYAFDQVTPLLKAIRDFATYNTDPKASIIGTYETFATPSLGKLDLNQAAIMFLVYDGPDAGDAFKNFTSLPSLLNTMGRKTYQQVVNLPAKGGATFSAGDNIFRVQVHSLDHAAGYTAAFKAWSKWAADNKGKYTLTSLDFEPVPKSLTEASNAQHGGNAMQMPSGPWIWLNFLLTTSTTSTDKEYAASQKSFKDMVNSVPNTPGLPLFINDGNYDQDPLQTFSTLSRLQEIKKSVDPDGFFRKYTGGWSFADASVAS